MSEVSEHLTKDDFMQSGFEIIMAQCDEKECARYSSRFAARAREAEEAGNTKVQGVFRLLSSITSLHLKLDTPEDPFGPMVVFHDRRTAMRFLNSSSLLNSTVRGVYPLHSFSLGGDYIRIGQ